MGMPTLVSDLMTKDPVTVSPDTSIVEAANFLSKYRINGLPVIAKDRTLVGIVTEYDFLTKGSAMHLPTVLKLLQGIEIYRNDNLAISDDIKKIFAMRVQDVMNTDPLTLRADEKIEDGLKAFAEHHRVDPIPIVDGEKKLVGVLSRYDIVKMFSAPSAAAVTGETDRSLDRKVSVFVSDLDKQFFLVSKTRTHYWLLWSLLFAIVGFIVAFALIIRTGP